MKNTVLVTTKWDELTEKATGDIREEELISNPDYWKSMIDRGARTARQDNGPVSARAIVGMTLGYEPVELQIVGQGAFENIAEMPDKQSTPSPKAGSISISAPAPAVRCSISRQTEPIVMSAPIRRLEVPLDSTAYTTQMGEEERGKNTLGRLVGGFWGGRKPSERQEEMCDRVESLLNGKGVTQK